MLGGLVAKWLFEPPRPPTLAERIVKGGMRAHEEVMHASHLVLFVLPDPITQVREELPAPT